MKAATLPLPVTPEAYPPGSLLPGQLREEVPAFPRIERAVHKGPLLHPGPIAEQADVLSLNLTSGCVHRCAFCSVRAYPTYSGDDVVYLASDVAGQLAKELAHRHTHPRVVFISPSTDPFPPVKEIQEEVVRVVEVLAHHGVEAWLMTRGFIRPAIVAGLLPYREQIKITISLTTLDRGLQRILEPLASPPRLRLRQVEKLRRAGFPVQVALEPLIPNVTDTRANLLPLLEGLAGAGISQVSASYMFLRPGIRDNLVRALEKQGWADMVLDAYADGRTIKMGNLAPACYYPKSRRQRGYAALMALASELGISVRISGITNADFQSPRRVEGETIHRQMLLPLF